MISGISVEFLDFLDFVDSKTAVLLTTSPNDSINRPATPIDRNRLAAPFSEPPNPWFSANFRPRRPQLGSNSSLAAPDGSVDTEFPSLFHFWPPGGPINGRISRPSLSGESCCSICFALGRISPEPGLGKTGAEPDPGDGKRRSVCPSISF